MAHSYTNLLYHIIFSTKDRRQWIDPELRPRLYEYLSGGIRGEGGIVLSINGITDHIHILAKLRQDRALSEVLRSIKANSSGWVHQTFSGYGGFAWQSGYAAFTVSQSQVESVCRYIRNQEKHHRRISFKEELIALLKAHRIDFDEKYLWD